MTANHGDNVTFTCTITGQGTLASVWLSPTGCVLTPTGQQMPNNNTFISVLTIVDVSGMDGGKYTCLASNEAGNTSATAEIFIRPVILSQPMDVLASSGEPVTLNCSADGFPLFYQWQKLNRTLDEMFDCDGGSASASASASASGSGIAGNSNYVYIEHATDSVLELNPVEFGDEGVYRCMAFNQVGTATSETATVTGTYRKMK